MEQINRFYDSAVKYGLISIAIPIINLGIALQMRAHGGSLTRTFIVISMLSFILGTVLSIIGTCKIKYQKLKLGIFLSIIGLLANGGFLLYVFIKVLEKRL